MCHIFKKYDEEFKSILSAYLKENGDIYNNLSVLNHTMLVEEDYKNSRKIYKNVEAELEAFSVAAAIDFIFYERKLNDGANQEG